jgi:hypothetical protein
MYQIGTIIRYKIRENLISSTYIICEIDIKNEYYLLKPIVDLGHIIRVEEIINKAPFNYLYDSIKSGSMTIDDNLKLKYLLQKNLNI